MFVYYNFLRFYPHCCVPLLFCSLFNVAFVSVRLSLWKTNHRLSCETIGLTRNVHVSETNIGASSNPTIDTCLSMLPLLSSPLRGFR